MARLRCIQKVLCSHSSWFMIDLESELIIELENLIDQEELLWRQKSRSNWKQKNRIHALKISDGTWCDVVMTLREEPTEYFASLFSMNSSLKESFPIKRSFS
ncbi:hypothetical protein V6N13_110875 [Hibiscus sabdariffa]